jgi:Gas vesicle protein G
MGLFKSLALLPLAPVQGVVWVAEQIQTQVDRQMLDPSAVLAELTRYQEALDEGVITEEEYLTVEDELLDRLDALGPGQ